MTRASEAIRIFTRTISVPRLSPHQKERCDAHDGPAKANPPVVDAQRGPKDDHCSRQVQPGLADVGNGMPCARIPEAGDESGHRDAPGAGREGDEESIARDSAAGSPVRMGAGSVRRLGTLCRADEPTGGDGERADHARYRSLEEWSWTRDREYLSTVPVPREPEQAP